MLTCVIKKIGEVPKAEPEYRRHAASFHLKIRARVHD
jgi:hypothetical protein